MEKQKDRVPFAQNRTLLPPAALRRVQARARQSHRLFWKTLLVKFLLLLPLLALAGCTTTNVTELVKAAAADPAAVHVKIMSPYFSIELDRAVPPPAK